MGSGNITLLDQIMQELLIVFVQDSCVEIFQDLLLAILSIFLSVFLCFSSAATTLFSFIIIGVVLIYHGSKLH